MVHRMLLTAALAVLAGPAVAQDEKPAVQDRQGAGEQKTSFVKDEPFPFTGEVTVERLNVRLFPKADVAAPGIIATVLAQGEKVTVTGEKGDYFEILPPRGTSVWIFARNVKKEADDAGTVIQNNAPVRLDSRNNAEQLATLNEGARVKILREHMGWYQIAAPDQVKYFVARKYVRNVGKPEAAPAVKATVAPDAEAEAKIKEAEALASEQHRLLSEKQIDKLDFAQVAAAFDAAAALAKSEDLKNRAQAQAKVYKQIAAIYAAIDKQRETVEQTIQTLKDKIAEKDRVVEPKWAFTGHVDTVGRLWNRPGAHKLVMAGKIVCFLKSKDEETERKLNSLFEKYVGVTGTVVKDPEGWPGHCVVVIESVEELKK